MGSSNQKILALTDTITLPAPHSPVSGHIAEFTIHPDGTLTATGFPDACFVKGLAHRCTEI